MILQTNRMLHSQLIDPNKHVEYKQELTDHLDAIGEIQECFLRQTFKLYINDNAQLIAAMAEQIRKNKENVQSHVP